jgi:hypothetical protein
MPTTNVNDSVKKNVWTINEDPLVTELNSILPKKAQVNIIPPMAAASKKYPKSVT